MPDEPRKSGKALIDQARELLKHTGEHTSLSKQFLGGLVDSDDWSLIIKLHAIMELALNILITQQIGDSRVSEIVERLDTSDKQRGKMAFVKALGLLPSEARSFISKLSELRNSLVHDIFQFDFSLEKWIKEMNSEQFSNFTKSLNFTAKESGTFGFPHIKMSSENYLVQTLRQS